MALASACSQSAYEVALGKDIVQEPDVQQFLRMMMHCYIQAGS